MKRIGFVAACLGFTACVPIDDELGLPEDISSSEQPAMVLNAMVLNAMVLNALSTNFHANGRMTEVPLTTDTYDPDWGEPKLRFQLVDPNARVFMQYLVGCALDANQRIGWTNPWTQEVFIAKGQLGICPEWGHPQDPAKPQNGRASERCQELVSACLLARVNKFGVAVPLSLRGEDTSTKFKTAPATPVTETASNSTDKIASFNACPTQMYNDRDCGWRPLYVGKCIPNTEVTVGAGAPSPKKCGTTPIGSSTADMMLRVCEGIRGCDRGDKAFLKFNDDACAPKREPAVDFTCPASGLYSVMEAPYNSTSTGTASPAAIPASAEQVYPAPEKKVFVVEEGATYGNIFKPSKLATEVYINFNAQVPYPVYPTTRVEGSVYRDMWACQASSYSAEAMKLKARVCMDTGYDCAAKVVGNCGTYCNGTDFMDDYNHLACRDNKIPFETWYRPLTVFLSSTNEL